MSRNESTPPYGIPRSIPTVPATFARPFASTSSAMIGGAEPSISKILTSNKCDLLNVQLSHFDKSKSCSQPYFSRSPESYDKLQRIKCHAWINPKQDTPCSQVLINNPRNFRNKVDYTKVTPKTSTVSLKYDILKKDLSKEPFHTIMPIHDASIPTMTTKAMSDSPKRVSRFLRTESTEIPKDSCEEVDACPVSKCQDKLAHLKQLLAKNSKKSFNKEKSNVQSSIEIDTLENKKESGESTTSEAKINKEMENNIDSKIDISHSNDKDQSINADLFLRESMPMENKNINSCIISNVCSENNLINSQPMDSFKHLNSLEDQSMTDNNCAISNCSENPAMKENLCINSQSPPLILSTKDSLMIEIDDIPKKNCNKKENKKVVSNNFSGELIDKKAILDCKVDENSLMKSENSSDPKKNIANACSALFSILNVDEADESACAIYDQSPQFVEMSPSFEISEQMFGNKMDKMLEGRTKKGKHYKKDKKNKSPDDKNGQDHSQKNLKSKLNKNVSHTLKNEDTSTKSSRTKKNKKPKKSDNRNVFIIDETDSSVPKTSDNNDTAEKNDVQCSTNDNVISTIYFCPETSKLFTEQKSQDDQKSKRKTSPIKNLCGLVSQLKTKVLGNKKSDENNALKNCSSSESLQSADFDEISGKFQTQSSGYESSDDGFTIVFSDAVEDVPDDKIVNGDGNKRIRQTSECGSEDSFIICFEPECGVGDCYTYDDIETSDSDESSDDDSDTYQNDDQDSVDGNLIEKEPDVKILKGCIKKTRSRGSSPRYASKVDQDKKVSFDPKPPRVHKMIVWSYAYQQARIGKWQNFSRDAERFKQRIMEASVSLDWVFKREHRSRVFFQRFRPILMRQLREEKQAKLLEIARLKKEKEDEEERLLNEKQEASQREDLEKESEDTETVSFKEENANVFKDGVENSFKSLKSDCNKTKLIVVS